MRGESRSGGVRASCPAAIGICRETTFVSLRDNGHVDLGLNRSNLPPLQEINRPASAAALSGIIEEDNGRHLIIIVHMGIKRLCIDGNVIDIEVAKLMYKYL